MPGGWRPLLPMLVKERVHALGNRPPHLPVDSRQRRLWRWAQWRRQHLRLRSGHWSLLHRSQEPVQLLQDTGQLLMYVACICMCIL